MATKFKVGNDTVLADRKHISNDSIVTKCSVNGKCISEHKLTSSVASGHAGHAEHDQKFPQK